jgi:hypothetical protein
MAIEEEGAGEVASHVEWLRLPCKAVRSVLVVWRHNQTYRFPIGT